MGLDIVDDMMEIVESLGGLRIEVDVFGEVELLDIIDFLDYDSLLASLTHQAKDFGMTVFAKYHYLGIRGSIVLAFDAALQSQHHRAGGIDNLDVVALGKLVGLRRFAMGSQQDFYIVELGELLMVDGDEPFGMEAFYFHAVVYDIAKAI